MVAPVDEKTGIVKEAKRGEKDHYGQSETERKPLLGRNRRF